MNTPITDDWSDGDAELAAELECIREFHERYGKHVYITEKQKFNNRRSTDKKEPELWCDVCGTTKQAIEGLHTN